MRRRPLALIPVAAVLVATASALPATAGAPGGAAARSRGEDRGVVMALPPRGPDPGGVRVRFAALSDRAYRRDIAGRRLRLTCIEVTAGGVESEFSATVRAPRRRVAFDSGLGGRGHDYCLLRVLGRGSRELAVVGFSAAGRQAVGERAAAFTVFSALSLVVAARQVDGVWPDVRRYVGLGSFERTGGRPSVLGSPAADPPPGTTGIYVDPAAERIVVVRRAEPGGRRVFAELTGLDADPTFTTNEIGWYVEYAR